MPITRTLLMLLAALLVLAGCGGGDDASPDEPRDASSPRGADTEPDSPEDRAAAKTAGTGTFALTPELQGCMEAAGYTQDAPPTGGLVAWRHESGGRVVVASSDAESVTGGIADEIGTEFLAVVSQQVVIAAPAEHAQAAEDCLRRFGE